MSRRSVLPSVQDRITLGTQGLSVSPICVGAVKDSSTISEAFDRGVNFFFVSLDLHWPLYEATRRGLADLFSRGPRFRDDAVVAVVSYLDEPLFAHFQAHEFVRAVPRVRWIDAMIAGAVTSEHGFRCRSLTLADAAKTRRAGVKAVGASFHQRPVALAAANEGLLDVAYVRYNCAHPTGADDLFARLPRDGRTRFFTFKSTQSVFDLRRRLPPGLPWVPEMADGYRFALTRPEVDGVLCALQNVADLDGIIETLAKGGLTEEQEALMIRLAARPATATRGTGGPTPVSRALRR